MRSGLRVRGWTFPPGHCLRVHPQRVRFLLRVQTFSFHYNKHTGGRVRGLQICSFMAAKKMRHNKNYNNAYNKNYNRAAMRADVRSLRGRIFTVGNEADYKTADDFLPSNAPWWAYEGRPDRYEEGIEAFYYLQGYRPCEVDDPRATLWRVGYFNRTNQYGVYDSDTRYEYTDSAGGAAALVAELEYYDDSDVYTREVVAFVDTAYYRDEETIAESDRWNKASLLADEWNSHREFRLGEELDEAELYWAY